MICWRPSGLGRFEIRRALSAEERQSLTERQSELQGALRPYATAEREDVEISIAAMFHGFRSMSRQDGARVADTIEVTLAVLRDFPAWAIERVCFEIACHSKDDWAPNDNKIYAAVEAVLARHRARLRTVDGLLDAISPRGR